MIDIEGIQNQIKRNHIRKQKLFAQVTALLELRKGLTPRERTMLKNLDAYFKEQKTPFVDFIEYVIDNWDTIKKEYKTHPAVKNAEKPTVDVLYISQIIREFFDKHDAYLNEREEKDESLHEIKEFVVTNGMYINTDKNIDFLKRLEPIFQVRIKYANKYGKVKSKVIIISENVKSTPQLDKQIVYEALKVANLQGVKPKVRFIPYSELVAKELMKTDLDIEEYSELVDEKFGTMEQFKDKVRACLSSIKNIFENVFKNRCQNVAG